MADWSFQRLSVCFILVLTLILILEPSKSSNKIPNTRSSSVVALKVDKRNYPGRNSSGCSRHSHDSRHPPSCKVKAGIYLINATLTASYFILLAGDVSENPGPTKDLCGLCSKICRRNQKAIQCDECDTWYHAKCMDMSNTEYANLCNPSSTWSCTNCLFPMAPNICTEDVSSSSTDLQYTPEEHNIRSPMQCQTMPKLLRGLRIGHLNVNRLYNKLDQIKELLTELSLDILGISETWLTADILNNELHIQGYTLTRRDRQPGSKSQGGGLAVFIKDGVNFKVRSDLMKSDTECIWLEICRPKCKPFIIGHVYKPPDVALDHCIRDLESALHFLESSKIEIALLGDFNVDMKSSTKTKGQQQELHSFLVVNDLKQIIETPTRVCQFSSTLIDLICVNNYHRVVQKEVIATPISDHSIVLCVFKSGVPKIPARTYETRSFKNYNKCEFRDDLKSVPWHNVETAESVDDAVLLWERLYSEVADRHAPIKKKRVKGHKTPWVTNKLLEIRRDRDYHLRKARASSSPYHWNMYKKLRNYSNHEDRRLKSEHFRNLIEENKSDSNQMWKALKQTLPSKNCSEVKAIKVKKKFFHHPREIAEALNKHFSTIGQKLANAMCPSSEEVLVEPTSKSKFSLNHVSTEFVARQLRGLKTNKAAGLDKISARLLKDSADIISPVLQYLINLSIDQNSFPNSWKSAKVVALFKNGDSSDCDNYRPISILPTASKILECAVYSQFYAHLESEKLLFVRQFGFRQSMSTSHALLEFCDSLLNNMDRGNVSGVIYLDLKKAFDTVNHAILLKKLTST